jgi:hypothetical protein
MFKIDYNSWFIRKYLQYGEYSTLPNTVCQLGRRILAYSLLYLVGAVIGGVFAALYLTGLFGLLYVLFTDTTMAEFFNFGQEVATWTNLALNIFGFMNVIFIGFGLISVYSWNKQRLRLKAEDEKHAIYAETGVWPTRQATPIGQFAKGIWERIHDKTCALISWDNDPQTIRDNERRERRERERKELEEAIAALKEVQNQPANNA